MPEPPFDFLLALSDGEAMAWLRAYLLARRADGHVRVPKDLEPVEHLLGQVLPLGNAPLAQRVGTLAARLLAEVIAAGGYRARDAEQDRFIGALFTLVEALPVSDETTEFLQDLAVSGRLLDGAGQDFHLRALRALVLHQRPRPGHVGRYIALWKSEADELRYAPVAIQGLLRISVSEAIPVLVEFVRRARMASPPQPLANTLFVVASELGTAQEWWQALRDAFAAHPEDLQATREVWRQLRLPETNPAAWEVLVGAVPRERPPAAIPWKMAYGSPDSRECATARDRLGDALLEPVAFPDAA